MMETRYLVYELVTMGAVREERPRLILDTEEAAQSFCRRANQRFSGASGPMFVYVLDRPISDFGKDVDAAYAYWSRDNDEDEDD